MTLRAFSLSLLVSCLAAAPTAAQNPARDRIAHNFGYVPLSDGIEIAYTLYRPTAEGRYPTLLIYNMYDASIVAPEWNQTVSTEVSDYLEAGYAVMGANVRGTACSTGVQDPLHAEQVGRDGAEVVEWIGRQPWSDGSVGMFGHSGSGITQFYVAAHNPGPLKAIIPGAAPADMYRDIAGPGGLFNYSFMYFWSEFAQPEQAERAARVHVASGDQRCAELLKRGFENPTWEEMSTRPLDDEWYEAHSVYSVASRIRVPAYVVFGWQDQSVFADAVGVFDQLQGPRKMLLAESGHSFYIRPPEVRREKIRFFDYWLKGKDNGIMDEKPIKVWLRMHGNIESIPERVLRIDRLPLPGTRWTKFFLHEDRSLKGSPPAKKAEAEYLYPAGATYVYGGSGYPLTPPEIGGLTFRTEPFEEETVLLGPTLVRLYAASTAPDTSFLVVLNEIDRQGKSRYLQRGYLRASMRTIDSGASTPHAPVYPFKEEIPLEPGQVTEFLIRLHPTGSIIEAGHALEILVMVPSVGPEPLGQWGFMPLERGINRVVMSPEHPSHVILPIVGSPLEN